jgi:hypothetical protein
VLWLLAVSFPLRGARPGYGAHADATGWRLIETDNEEGAGVLCYVREGIAADIPARKGRTSTFIRTARDEALNSQRRWVGGTLGLVSLSSADSAPGSFLDRLVGLGDTAGKQSRARSGWRSAR